MSGLLAKDMELLKINMKTYLAVFLIGFMYLIVQKNGSTFFVSYSIFVSIGVSVGTISYDAYHHGMNYLMTLPVTRKQYVWSKYLLGFCFAAVTGMAALLIGILKVQVTGNQEMQDLYAREGHNPMQMGCGPMIFQMIFLMGVIGIIYYPIQYVLGASGFNDASNEIYKVILPIYQQITGNADAKITYFQLNILENFPAYKEALMQSFPKIFTSTVCSDIETYRQGMTMFGLDMTRIPHWKDGIIVIIPILSLVTSLGSSFVSTIIQKKNNPAAGQQATQMMMMMLMMPFFSFYIAFKVTAAVGFYWTISNIIAIFQQLYIYKVHPPKKTQAKLMVENTIERRSREENIKKMTK